MITIRVPVDTILECVMPSFLILIGSVTFTLGIIKMEFVFIVMSLFFLVPGILWVLSMLNIVRFKTDD